MLRRSFPTFFRVIEREPPSFVSSSNQGRNNMRGGGRRNNNNNNNTKSSSSSKINLKTNNNESFHQQQYQRKKFQELQENSAQRNFEKKWKGSLDSSSSSFAASSEKNKNTTTAKPTKPKYSLLSRDDTIAARADELRRENFSSSSSQFNDSSSSIPKRFDEIPIYASTTSDGFSSKNYNNNKQDRRAALKRMKEAIAEERENATINGVNDRKSSSSGSHHHDGDDNHLLSTIEITRGGSSDTEENYQRLKYINSASKTHTAIAEESPLAQNILLKNSRRKKLMPNSTKKLETSWDLIDSSYPNNNISKKKKNISDNTDDVDSFLFDNNIEEENAEEKDDKYNFDSFLLTPQSLTSEEVAAASSEREWEQSEGHYRHTFDSSTMLEHHRDSVQHSRSIYSNRDLHLPDLWSYHSFITPLEEKEIISELVKLLLKPAAAFHANEGRYCVNLYEKRLGISNSVSNSAESNNIFSSSSSSTLSENVHNNNNNNKNKNKNSQQQQQDDNPLAFSLHLEAPKLLAVLERAARLDLIPSVPNVVQVSEMISAYSGYEPFLRHSSIGNYFGMMNLVSKAQLDLAHVDQTWSPKLLLMPRAMYVFGPEIIEQFRVGYKFLNKEVVTHQGSSRFTKDYRIEVMFATVDAESVPRLSLPVKVTDYATKREEEIRRREEED